MIFGTKHGKLSSSFKTTGRKKKKKGTGQGQECREIKSNLVPISNVENSSKIYWKIKHL